MDIIFEINNNIRYLVFDLGNTLYPHSVQIEAWKDALEGTNYDVKKFLEAYQTEFKPNAGGFSNQNKLIQVFDILNIQISKASIFDILLKYKNALRNGIDEYLSTDPYGTFAFLKKIMPHFEKFGILSDNTIETKIEWVTLLKKHGYGIFDLFIVSEEIKAEKPNEKAFQSIIDEIATLEIANKIMFFGDDLIKDKESLEVGMNFVHVYGHRENEDKYNPKIKYINQNGIRVNHRT